MSCRQNAKWDKRSQESPFNPEKGGLRQKTTYNETLNKYNESKNFRGWRSQKSLKSSELG
ncbi:hypothetical protein EGI26_16515 [Lacihabitans sp. CCS-44]|nr:hypothetical protein [Lacihabitans sp. CCS-44]